MSDGLASVESQPICPFVFYSCHNHRLHQQLHLLMWILVSPALLMFPSLAASAAGRVGSVSLVRDGSNPVPQLCLCVLLAPSACLSLQSHELALITFRGGLAPYYGIQQ